MVERLNGVQEVLGSNPSAPIYHGKLRGCVMNKVNVGLIGFGTVGAGVAKALLQKGRWLKRHVGARVVLRRVCDKEFRRSRGFRLPPGLTTTDPAKILRDPEIHILVVLIGGDEPAKTFIL